MLTRAEGFRFDPINGTLPVSLNLEQLLQRSRVSDPVVAEALVQHYYTFVYRLALSILDDPDEAEDATQEAFIAAVLNLDRYRGESSLKTWLYTIALNTCRGQLRKRKARYAMRTSWQALQALKAKPPTPEQSAMRNETDSILWRAVDDLHEKHRVPIILRYAHNLSVPEIAHILDISEGTVHSRLHYARRKLQGLLIQSEVLSKKERAE
jgi:RNA polymerase sigma-70 factor (ECF subfamily)